MALVGDGGKIGEYTAAMVFVLEVPARRRLFITIKAYENDWCNTRFMSDASQRQRILGKVGILFCA